MPLLRNIGVAATCKAAGTQSDIHELTDAAMAWREGRISWVGKEKDLPEQFRSEETYNAKGLLVVPGLIDCHTHLAFGSWRADEFEQRILGRTYLEIARSGGGIHETVERTRKASREALIQKCEGFLGEMAALGVTTVECKSGYGLDRQNELKILEVYEALGRRQPVRLVSTCLAAHLVPREYSGRRDEYVEMICRELLPEVAARGLARFCDVFVEEGAFSSGEARRILDVGKSLGLGPRLHADQLSDGGSAQLAAELGAASADHLEFVSDAGISALSDSGVTAVSLPLASLYLNQPPLAARRLIQAGVPVAVATDFNPGSAPSFHLPLAMMLGCNLSRMTPAEVLKGATYYAARTLKLENEIGSLEAGKVADFVVVDAPSVNQWLYHFRPNSCVACFIDGREVLGKWN